MLETELFEPTNAVDESAKKLGEYLMPMYQRYWKEAGRTKPLDFNVTAFLDMWLAHGCRVIISKRDGVPVGFCVCLIYRPMTYNSVIYHIQDIWWEDIEVLESMMNYIPKVARIIGCDEIRVNTTKEMKFKGWAQRQPEQIQVYTKE